MKALKREHNTFKLNDLPEISWNAFEYNGIKGHTGSIFRRKLKGAAGLLYWHYAFFYGFTERNEMLLIENNEDGVECVTWEDFALNRDWEIFHIEKNLNRKSEIMKRAHQIANEGYQGRDNNCEHCVNYCVFGERKSEQTENTEVFADVLISLLEFRVLLSPSSRDHLLLKQINDLRNLINIKRNDEFNNLIEKHTKKVLQIEKYNN